MMRAWSTWACLALFALACCSTPPPPPPEVSAKPPAVCRVGPDGSRPVADRGIGGTGAPSRVADRGIGGTGIIGVVTGFASLCVAGQEVALPDSVPARIDGVSGSLDDLRAGQLVAVEAAGPDGSLQARQVAVRHAVTGPVQSLAAGMITVAGQSVLLAGATGVASPRVGDWVAVSGLRQADGAIAASRIDPAPRGAVLVRGELIRTYGSARIGGLTVQLPDGATVPGGFAVLVRGRLEGAVLIVDSVTRDVAAESPSAYFGLGVDNFIVEADIAVVPGGYVVGQDFVMGASGFEAGASGRGVATYSRRAGGDLAATGLRLGGVTGAGAAAQFGPAGGNRTGREQGGSSAATDRAGSPRAFPGGGGGPAGVGPGSGPRGGPGSGSGSGPGSGPGGGPGGGPGPRR